MEDQDNTKTWILRCAMAALLGSSLGGAAVSASHGPPMLPSDLVAEMEAEEPVRFLPPLVLVPNRTMLPVVHAPAPPVASPPVAAPEAVTKPTPVVVAKPRAAPQAKPQQRRETERVRPAPKQQAAGCKPIPNKSCSDICWWARQFSEGALESLAASNGYCSPTGAQRARGKACIRSTCPEVQRR